MPKGIGQLRSLALDNRKWRIPADVSITFWSGGRHNSEFQDDNAGGTPVSKFTTGKITGMIVRTAQTGEMKDMIEVIKKTVETPVPCLIELANGEKWSAPVYAVIDEGGPFTSEDGKFTFDLYAGNDSGLFVQV